MIQPSSTTTDPPNIHVASSTTTAPPTIHAASSTTTSPSTTHVTSSSTTVRLTSIGPSTTGPQLLMLHHQFINYCQSQEQEEDQESKEEAQRGIVVPNQQLPATFLPKRKYTKRSSLNASGNDIQTNKNGTTDSSNNNYKFNSNK
ncbi:hypothetical protein ACTFIZ_001957 [Dictyostelium cf. discoideum]